MPVPPRPPGKSGRDSVAALAQVNRLQAALRRSDRAAVVEAIRGLVAMRAPISRQWVVFAKFAAQYGEVSLARQVVELHIATEADPAARFAMVEFLCFAGLWAEALELVRTLPEHQPNPATYAYHRGIAAMYNGEREEGRAWLERAIGHAPAWGGPWLSLQLMVDFSREPALLDRLVKAEAQMAAAPPGDRAIQLYTLAKAYADCGEHERVFATLERGAAVMQPQVTYDRERSRVRAENAVLGWDAERVAALASRQSEPTGKGIFVLGPLRSGTTLVEQILASHSTVSDGAEIYRLGLLAGDIRGIAHDAVGAYVAQGRAPEAARLWNHWLDDRFPGSERVVDKTNINTRLVGIAASLLPEAPLIWLTRDPLDCAWSCYRNYFPNEARWSFDLADIAHHFRLEHQLRTRWQEILGERLLVVPYEELARDPRPWIARILAHCGLPEEPLCFAPHENERPVTTTSAMQVRRPIHAAGIGSAKPYARFLEPFVKAYYR